jgi:hypothetical protein
VLTLSRRRLWHRYDPQRGLGFQGLHTHTHTHTHTHAHTHKYNSTHTTKFLLYQTLGDSQSFDLRRSLCCMAATEEEFSGAPTTQSAAIGGQLYCSCLCFSSCFIHAHSCTPLLLQRYTHIYKSTLTLSLTQSSRWWPSL